MLDHPCLLSCLALASMSSWNSHIVWIYDNFGLNAVDDTVHDNWSSCSGVQCSKVTSWPAHCTILVLCSSKLERENVLACLFPYESSLVAKSAYTGQGVYASPHEQIPKLLDEMTFKYHDMVLPWAGDGTEFLGFPLIGPALTAFNQTEKN